MNKTGLPILLLLLVLLTSACSPQEETLVPAPDQPVSSDDTPIPSTTPLGEDAIRQEDAIIEEINLLMMESFPLQVNVNVKGQLRDGCTVVEETWADRVDETTFEVHIRTARPADAICTEALVPFEENIPLEVNGLPAGTYTVKVYDLSTEFTFTQDNSLPE